MQLIMLGAPGVGKGTQAKLLSSKFQVPQVSTGDILRAAKRSGSILGNKVKEIIDKGDLVSDDIVNDLVKEKILSVDCINGFILDGYPRTTGQAATLDQFLKENNRSDLKVLYIEVPGEILVQRLLNRRSCSNCKHDFNLLASEDKTVCPKCNSSEIKQRADDNEESIRNRQETFEKSTFPLIKYYDQHNILMRFDGTKSVDEVFNKIINSI
jgi:adenylate kinase